MENTPFKTFTPFNALTPALDDLSNRKVERWKTPSRTETEAVFGQAILPNDHFSSLLDHALSARLHSNSSSPHLLQENVQLKETVFEDHGFEPIEREIERFLEDDIIANEDLV